MSLFVRYAKLSLSFLVIAAAISFVIPTTSFAVQSGVEVQVSSDAPLLQLTNIGGVSTSISPGIVYPTTTPLLRISGIISKLVQLRVYIDTQYSITVPLTANDTEFIHDLQIEPGTHSIMIEGVSSDSSQNPVVSFSAEYTPPAPQQNPTANGNAPGITSGGVTGATISSEPFTVPPSHSATVPQWLYGSLTFLDVIRPNAAGPTNYNTGGITLLVAGVLMILGAPLILRSYLSVRYAWFHLDKLDLSKQSRRRILLWVRLGGGILIICVFLWP